MKIATWNVNGIRARESQLLEWIEKESPDVFCLQEIKADLTQLPLGLGALSTYQSYFHGSGGYSGVSLHVKRTLAAELGSGGKVSFDHPPFDFETRVVEARLGDLSILSVYVPNGGKDYAAKLRFLEAFASWVSEAHTTGRRVVVCGDLNVAHRPIDVHPSQRDEKAVGQRPDERALFDRLLGAGLVDLTRVKFPEDPRSFTWWPYWKAARQRNLGWRIDYVLAPASMAERVNDVRTLREFGTSDHAPLVVELAGVG